MPLSPIHKEKQRKNFVLLGMIVAWVVVIFCVAIVKMKAGS